MLCPFLWNVDHRHAPSIYNQDTNRLWFLWDCYFRQLLYKSGSVLLENSGDKKSCKEHSKRMGWGREWIIAPLLEAKKWFPRCQYEGARVGMGMGSNVGSLLRTLPSNVTWDQIQASTTYLGWVCSWFSPLLWEVFLRVLRFSPLLKTNSLFFVGSLPCSERFFSGSSGFPSPLNQFFVCCWFSPLLWEVFLWVLRFSPLLKTNSFKVQFDL